MQTEGSIVQPQPNIEEMWRLCLLWHYPKVKWCKKQENRKGTDEEARNIHKKTKKRDDLLYKTLHTFFVILILDILKLPHKMFSQEKENLDTDSKSVSIQREGQTQLVVCLHWRVIISDFLCFGKQHLLLVSSWLATDPRLHIFNWTTLPVN